jgi:hypothetical protein
VAPDRARLEGVVSVLEEHDADGRRQLVRRDLLAAPQRVASPLEEERRGRERLQVRDAEPVGPSRRMEGVAEAHEPARTGLVGDHARDPASHRLPADHETGAPAQLRDDLEPSLAEHRRGIGTSAPSALAARAHVRELEPRDTDAVARDPLGDRRQEGRVHGRAGSVGQDERGVRVRRAVEEQVGHAPRIAHETS